MFPAGRRRGDASLDVPLGVDFRTGVRSRRVEFKEGIKAKKTVASSVTPSVKPSTRASGCRSRRMLEAPDVAPETMCNRSASAQLHMVSGAASGASSIRLDLQPDAR